MNIEKIYEIVAVKNGVTAQEVRADIDAAIRYAYSTGAITELLGNNKELMEIAGGEPTSEDSIKFAIEKTLRGMVD